MTNYMILSILVGLLLLGFAFLVIFQQKRKSGMQKDEKYPQGHFMGIGIATGMPIGLPIGLILGRTMDQLAIGLAIGPALGVALGTALGAYLEKKNKDKIRPLTKEELKMRKVARIALGIVLALGVLAFIGIIIYVR